MTIRTVTNGPWGFSSTHTSDAPHVNTINVYRIHEASRFKDRQFRVQYGQLNGTMVGGNYNARNAEIDRLGLMYGYLKPYSRNTCEFVMSRAARRRGHVTTNWMYLERAARGR
jgi:hypothetical protein